MSRSIDEREKELQKKLDALKIRKEIEAGKKKLRELRGKK